MRIKEEFKRDGDFWLPSNPQRRVSGTLSILDGVDVKLELTRPLDTSMQALFGYTDSLPQILGHVEKGGPVVIDRCYRLAKKRNVTHGELIASEIVSAKRAFIGLPYQEDTTPRFNTMTFSIEGVDEWVGISGIKVDAHFKPLDLTISYHHPEEISLNLENGMQLLITFAATIPGFPHTKRAEVTQKTYFKLISPQPRELEEFTAVIEKITAFLCFVMGEIVCLEKITATADNLHQDTGDGRTETIPVEIYCPSWPYSKDEPEINDRNILFKFKEIQSHVERTINKWIENYEQISPAFDLYFLAKTGTLSSWNMLFLTLVQALEAFHRRTSDEKHMNEVEFKKIRRKMIEDCPEAHRDWFRPKLQHANELTLRNRIEKMTEPFVDFMGGENREQLISSIVKTRNYLTHYDSKSESKAAKGRVLEFLCVKMNALFRLHFLKLIGFNEQEIDAIVDKCSSLKRECNLL